MADAFQSAATKIEQAKRDYRDQVHRAVEWFLENALEGTTYDPEDIGDQLTDDLADLVLDTAVGVTVQALKKAALSAILRALGRAGVVDTESWFLLNQIAAYLPDLIASLKNRKTEFQRDVKKILAGLQDALASCQLAQ